jgi:hypothetical protein
VRRATPSPIPRKRSEANQAGPHPHMNPRCLNAESTERTPCVPVHTENLPILNLSTGPTTSRTHLFIVGCSTATAMVVAIARDTGRRVSSG